jgi:hypothetical protein
MPVRRQVISRRDAEENVGVGFGGVSMKDRDLAAKREKLRTRPPLEPGIADAPSKRLLGWSLLCERSGSDGTE